MRYTQANKNNWKRRTRKGTRPYPGTFEYEIFVAKRLIDTVLEVVSLGSPQDVIEFSIETLTQFCEAA